MKLQLMFAGFFLCAAVIPVFAQKQISEENKLATCARELDKKHSEGQQRVADKIKEQFGVDDARLIGLSYKKLSYGEISIVLGLAQGLHGGLKDENLHKIVALRQGPPVAGWGKVAQALGLKLGPVISKVQKISADVRRQEKADKAKKDKKAKEEKTGKPEKPEKSKKMSQTGKTEKAGMLSLARP